MSKKLKIALPKGSLQDSTVELFRKAGYNIYVSSRGYRPTSDDDDLELFLIRHDPYRSREREVHAPPARRV